MWLAQVGGYKSDSRLNVALAILLVGAQIIVMLLIASLRRWRAESLTPSAGDS